MKLHASSVGYFSLLAMIAAGPVSAYAESCAQTKWVHGANCEDLKVIFDLSACGGSPNKVGDIMCEGGEASATAETKTQQFRQTLKLNAGKWVATGPMLQIAAGEKFPAHSEEVAVAEKAPAKAEREPAEAAEGAKTSEEKSADKAEKPKANGKVTTGDEDAEDHGESAEKSENPEEEGTEGALGLQFSGLFDGYYQWNFNRPGPVAQLTPSTTGATQLQTIPAGNTALRTYDIYHNQAALNLAELEIKKKGAEVGFLLDLDFGHEADLNAQGLVAGTPVDDVSKYIGQAFVTYTPKWAEGLSFDFGKMGTHITYETPKSSENWNYSRSMIFTYGVPLWHVGARAGYEIVPHLLEANLYIYNGWNTLYDQNSAKTYGAQLKYTPSKHLALTYNYIGGPEQSNNDNNWRTVHEANGTFVVTPKLALAFEAATGHESNFNLAGTPVTENWEGLALYGKYRVTERYYVSPRIEAFRDNQGGVITTNVPTTVMGYTLTNAYEIAHGLQLRLEFRNDRVNNDVVNPYLSSSGPQPKQTTATLGVIYEL